MAQDTPDLAPVVTIQGTDELAVFRTDDAVTRRASVQQIADFANEQGGGGTDTGTPAPAPDLTPYARKDGAAFTGTVTITEANFTINGEAPNPQTPNTYPNSIAMSDANFSIARGHMTLNPSSFNIGANVAVTGNHTMSVGRDPTGDMEVVARGYADSRYARIAVTPADDLYFGSSADATPSGAELTIAAESGAGVIPAWTGGRHMLIARLATEGDIASVTFSDDQSGTNQVGAFTKYSGTVTPTGETAAFNVWVSDELLIQPAPVTVTVR